MSDLRKPFWPWIVALLIGLPVLYVLSSGPAQTILIGQPRFSPFKPFSVHRYYASRKMHGWDTIYAPLILASHKNLGEPLRRYWRLFPIPSEQP
jgi:hypothetical protein